MEVPGKVWNGEDMIQCNLCEDDDKVTEADGLCEECDEYMCCACFDKHKRRKISRHHELKELKEAQSLQKNKGNDELDKCTQHFNELIKFYCEQHEEFGCGDCMIYKHKMCKVEYIRDKASTFKESQDFKDLVKGAEKSYIEAKEMLSSIKNNKIQVVDINKKFTQEVNIFKEEIISHVTKLADAMLKQGEDVKATDMKRLDKLEKEHEILVNEISGLTEMFESKIDQPQKLFVSSILQKSKLRRLRGQLDKIKGEKQIEVYEFKHDVTLERSLKDGKQLGSIEKIKPRNETDDQEEVKPKKTAQVAQAPVQLKPQPLLDRQLICRNITADGEYLSYVDNGSGDVGLYVDKNHVFLAVYMEVEILNMGQRGTIAIGLVPNNYPKNQQPGWGEDSIGYHADDGKLIKINAEWLACQESKLFDHGLPCTCLTIDRLYNRSGSGVRFGPKCNAGDRIGCGIIYDGRGIYRVVFIRNGERIGQKNFYAESFLHPAIGMHSAGEKMRVILDAKMS